MPKLSLPAKTHLSLSWKQIGLAVLVVVVIVVSVFLTISGQWRLVQQLFLRVRMKDREVKLARLQAQQEANVEKLKQEADLRATLEATRKRLEQERLEAQLEIEGKGHDEIVSELRRRFG